MSEETKNFSALVLQRKIMTENQVEECIAHQESLAVHGLEKPIWVIALEKGFLPQEKYKEVVLGVRWVGIRQKDRRFRASPGPFLKRKGAFRGNALLERTWDLRQRAVQDNGNQTGKDRRLHVRKCC